MIKNDSNIQRAYCDTCHVHIFSCTEFEWQKDQELRYSPLFCEKCGAKKSEEIGKNIKHIQLLEKALKILLADPEISSLHKKIFGTHQDLGVKDLESVKQEKDHPTN